MHITGDTTKTTICITEGGLKGNIASYLKEEALFVCVPGVNNIEFLVDTLTELCPEKILVCYDMDLLKNAEVTKALNNMRQSVME